MPSLVDDIQVAASMVARALTLSGYKADFSPRSLWELDRFFLDQTRDGEASPGGLLATETGTRVFALGGYLGEVLRRQLGGTWKGDESDEHAEMNVELHLPAPKGVWPPRPDATPGREQDSGAGDAVIVYPVQQVMRRIVHGAEDSVVLFAIGFGLPLGDPPQPTGASARLIARLAPDSLPAVARELRRKRRRTKRG